MAYSREELKSLIKESVKEWRSTPFHNRKVILEFIEEQSRLHHERVEPGLSDGYYAAWQLLYTFLLDKEGSVHNVLAEVDKE